MTHARINTLPAGTKINRGFFRGPQVWVVAHTAPNGDVWIVSECGKRRTKVAPSCKVEVVE